MFPPSAFFTFEEKIDFGYIEEGSNIVWELVISNDGSEKGSLNLIS